MTDDDFAEERCSSCNGWLQLAHVGASFCPNCDDDPDEAKNTSEPRYPQGRCPVCGDGLHKSSQEPWRCSCPVTRPAEPSDHYVMKRNPL